MKQYPVRSKMFGYKIGLSNDNLYVAVPSKYFKGNQIVEVICDNESKIYSQEDKVLEATQADKYGRGLTHTLYYFLWKIFT